MLIPCTGLEGRHAEFREELVVSGESSVMVDAMKETTTITIARATQQRLAHVTFNGKPLKTADETVAALIEEHERRQFWEAMDAIDPEEYGAQTREEGTWPTEDEYAVEERLVQAQETPRDRSAR